MGLVSRPRHRERNFHSVGGSYTEDSYKLFAVLAEDRTIRNSLESQQKGKLPTEGVLHRKIEC